MRLNDVDADFLKMSILKTAVSQRPEVIPKKYLKGIVVRVLHNQTDSPSLVKIDEGEGQFLLFIR